MTVIPGIVSILDDMDINIKLTFKEAQMTSDTQHNLMVLHDLPDIDDLTAGFSHPQYLLNKDSHGSKTPPNTLPPTPARPINIPDRRTLSSPFLTYTSLHFDAGRRRFLRSGGARLEHAAVGEAPGPGRQRGRRLNGVRLPPH